MSPMISYDAMLYGASALIIAGLLAWAIYEVCTLPRKNRYVIRESRYFQHGREIRAQHDCWEIDGTRVH